MVYLPRTNPRVFQGQLAPWARSYAAWATRELVRSKSHVSFIAPFAFDPAPCLIAPDVTVDRIEVIALYDLRKSLKAARLAEASFHFVEDLVGEWRGVCRGYVHFAIEPNAGIVGINHDASIRGALAAQGNSSFRAPTISEIDQALNTRLLDHRFVTTLITEGA